MNSGKATIALAIVEAALIFLHLPTLSINQKGMGGNTGIAREQNKPDIVTLEGEIQKIITERCEMTTGRFSIGTHMTLTTDDGQTLNIHLGPARMVNDLVEELPVGRQVTVHGFRTEKLPAQHYIAQRITWADQQVRLRGDDLQPRWARARGERKMRGEAVQARDQRSSRGPEATAEQDVKADSSRATTRVTVRVLSTGAKFVGSSMGGCLITIRNADTDELLARGLTEGTTGDTQRIMNDRHTTHAPVSTSEAASFTADLELQRPTRIEVTALGPLAQRQAANRASLTQWVVPGKDVTGGDAMLLELRGFVVDIKQPPAHQKLSDRPVTITLSANVTMMCGCPIEPDGTWDADDYEISAIIRHDGNTLRTIPLKFAGETSQFHASLQLDKPGLYEATVYAYNPDNGNTGLDKVTWIIE